MGDVDWVARAKALAPMIAEAADQTERDRRVTPGVIAAMHDAEIFRICLPRSIGGGEVELRTMIEVLEIVAGADASTAWCLGQAFGCSLTAAYVTPETAREIFGPADSVVAWGAANTSAVAVATEGGYRVTGEWPFASGIRNATWHGAHILVAEADGSPRLGPDGKQLRRTMVWPRANSTVTNVWRVIGLEGTGSDNYAVDDLLVPDRFVFIRDGASDRREAGPLYRFALTPFYGAGFAGVLLGIARPALDAFVELASGKIAGGTSRRLAENTSIQEQVAKAEARLRSARAFLMEMVAEVWEIAGTGRDFTLDERARLRIASTHAMTEARDVVDFAYRAAGASAILKGNPFERRFRDMNAAAQQIQGQPSNMEQAGQVFFGMEGPFTRL